MNNRNAELRLTVSQSGSVTAVFGVHVQIVGTEQVVVKISRLSGTHSLQCTVVLHALNAGFVGLDISGSELNLVEGGAALNLQVSLTGRPDGSMTVHLSARRWVSNPGGVTTLTEMPSMVIGPATLTFTPEARTLADPPPPTRLARRTRTTPAVEASRQ